MKNFGILCLVTLSAASLAQTPNWNFSLSSAVRSRYVGGLGGALFVDKPVWQTGLFGFHRSGFYVGLWQSLPIEGGQWHTFARETDYIAGFSRDVCRGQFNLDLSGSIYELNPTGNLYAINLAVTSNVGAVRPYVVIEHDFAESATLPPGTVYKFGARGGATHLPLTWDAALLGNCGLRPYGGRVDTISAGRVQLGWPVKTSGGTWCPGLVLQRKLGRTGGIARNQVVYELSWSYKF